MRLSDALRSAADRAPLDGLEVDTDRARRRVTTQRGLRMGANGTLAGGMVVVLGFGISGLTGSSTNESAAMEESASDSASIATADDGAEMGGDLEMDSSGAGSTSLAWGLCGQTLPYVDTEGAPVDLSAAIGNEPAEGEPLAVTVTATSHTDGTFETFGLDGVVLWDGVVVATLAGDPGDATVSELAAVTLDEGGESVDALSVPLENCWDGEALPAGKYELVLTQEYYATAVAEEPPALEDVPEPEATEESAGSDESTGSDGSTDAAESTDSAEPAPAIEDQATDPADDSPMIDELPDTVVAGGGAMRAVSDPLGFVIEGAAPDEPFADYLSAPVEPAPEPDPADPDATDPPVGTSDSALDAASAREMYLAGLTGAWDMAAGTQRWTVSSDSRGEIASQWYGCGSEGAFPARSAEMDLLDVDVTAPASIGLSYGWVVDGNPVLSAEVRNTSDQDLTQFWGQTELHLLLVRNGRVAAEAYGVNPDRQDMYGVDMIAAAEAEAGAEPSYVDTSTLAAGASRASDFLWRDLEGCWTDAGPTTVTPGSYTLLAGHYLSVGGYAVAVDEWDAWEDESAIEDVWPDTGDTGGLGLESDGDDVDLGVATSSGAVGGGSVGTDSAMAVAPDGYDALDLMVWTSLGTITVR
ncbi:hypothetical protein [Demequina mangrovi]|nr:hypothetical protein [Demequina mangrovi]